MFLQILPPDNIATEHSNYDNQLLLVVLGLAFSVFVIIRLAKLLSKLKIN
ncbi:hypothetical protein [Polaribacter sp. Z022]|nr:hypothetical protein [Polaribacter sp. Z022]MCL7752738.1 hypothetical protein [Polaribacter sp. Z022]